MRSAKTSPSRRPAIELHDLAAPVDVRSILPAVAGIEQKRRRQRRLRGGDDARLTVLRRQPIVGLVEEVVAEPGRVQHQHARGDVPLRRPQSRLAGIVETLDDLQLAEVRNIGPCGRVEIELALLDELQSRRTGDRLGGRKDRKDAVGRHRVVFAEGAFSGCALVDDALAVRGHGDDARNAGSARHNAIEDGVRRGGKLADHCFLLM